MKVRVIGLCNVRLVMWASDYSRYKHITATCQVIYYPATKFVIILLLAQRRYILDTDEFIL